MPQRFGGDTALCDALAIPPEQQRIPVQFSEVLKLLHAQLTLYEPPAMRHKVAEGVQTSAFDIIVAEEDPIIVRRSSLHRTSVTSHLTSPHLIFISHLISSSPRR